MIDEQLRVLEVIVEDLLSAVNAHKLYAETSTGPGSKSSTLQTTRTTFPARMDHRTALQNVGRHPIDKFTLSKTRGTYDRCCSCGTVAAKMQYRARNSANLMMKRLQIAITMDPCLMLALAWGTT